MNWLARLKRIKDPVTLPTETTKTVFVVSVAYPNDSTAKNVDTKKSANDPTQTPNRHCWPHSLGMNDVEIDMFIRRLSRFTDGGQSLDAAERLADQLLLRDREEDDRRLCIECTHLQGLTCTNWRIAQVPKTISRDFLKLLQRCPGFKCWQ